jgi:uroporphyrinogen-III synthase
LGRAAFRRRSGRARGGARTNRRTVVLTRPAGRNEQLAGRLRELGFDVVVRPLVEIEVVETGPIDLDGYDWLVLTSATGAHELRRRARGRAARVAAIGRATAEAWGEGEVDLVPAVATQEGLLAELPRPAGRVLFAGAEGARPLLADELAADVVVLYRTSPVEAEVEGDLAVVASPSAARALAAANRALPVVSIGAETTAAARAAGLRVTAEAQSPDLDGLVAAVAAAE